jgi:hypothetical protein
MYSQSVTHGMPGMHSSHPAINTRGGALNKSPTSDADALTVKVLCDRGLGVVQQGVPDVRHRIPHLHSQKEWAIPVNAFVAANQRMRGGARYTQ